MYKGILDVQYTGRKTEFAQIYPLQTCRKYINTEE